MEIKKIEAGIVRIAKKYLKNNIVSLYATGSFGSGENLAGWSDYDLLIILKEKGAVKIDFQQAVPLKHLEIKYHFWSYPEFLKRLRKNQSYRFIGNLDLIKLAKKSKLLFGQQIHKNINVREILKRDLETELRMNYLHATNMDPQWNIFKRKPKNQVGYIINMADAMLISQGILIKKEALPQKIRQHFPNFKFADTVERAVNFRRRYKNQPLNTQAAAKIKKDLKNFLTSYRDYYFFYPDAKPSPGK